MLALLQTFPALVANMMMGIEDKTAPLRSQSIVMRSPRKVSFKRNGIKTDVHNASSALSVKSFIVAVQTNLALSDISALYACNFGDCLS